MGKLMIGTQAWCELTQGNLSFKEKIKLSNQILIPSLLSYIKTFQHKYQTQPLIHLNSVKIPDTALALEALETIQANATDSIIQHSWRCYFWSIAFGQVNNWTFDEESIFVASILHDIGLVDSTMHSCQCFTKKSASISEQLCQKHELDEEKIKIISDAICLHMNGYLDSQNSSITKEALLLQQATSFDVIGSNLYKLDRKFVNDVLTLHPLLNFNQDIRTQFQKEALLNPNSRTALMNKLGLPMMIKLSQHFRSSKL